MVQESIHVQVMRFERENASQDFRAHLARDYDTIIDLDQKIELPVYTINRDSKGNTLSYIGCLVERNKPAVARIAKETIAQQTVEKPVRKARSVVAKGSPSITTPEPEPVVKPAPAKSKKPVAPIKPVRPSAPKAEPLSVPTPKRTVKPAPVEATPIKPVKLKKPKVVIEDAPEPKPKKTKRETVDLSDVFAYIKTLKLA